MDGEFSVDAARDVSVGTRGRAVAVVRVSVFALVLLGSVSVALLACWALWQFIGSAAIVSPQWAESKRVEIPAVHGELSVPRQLVPR